MKSRVLGGLWGRLRGGLRGIALCAVPALAAAAPAPAASAAASAPSATATHTVPDTMGQRLMACTACHGKEGRATNEGYFPRIAGKPADYLYRQLLHFRDGRRNNFAMAKLTEFMSDAYLRQIAEHFAALDLPYPPPQTEGAPPAMLAHGEQLVKQGDPQRTLPACVACHGAAMTGVLPAMPGLLGLPRDYVVGQLGKWRSGLRNAAAPDCMADIAKRLTREDITAVSTWLASQPIPPGAKPAAAPTEPPPMPCGGLSQ